MYTSKSQYFHTQCGLCCSRGYRQVSHVSARLPSVKTTEFQVCEMVCVAQTRPLSKHIETYSGSLKPSGTSYEIKITMDNHTLDSKLITHIFFSID